MGTCSGKAFQSESKWFGDRANPTAGVFLFLQATNITVSFYAASSVIAGDMTLGMMMSLTYILGQMSVPVSDFINFVQSYQYAK